MKHYMHFLEIKLTGVSYISEKKSLTEEELKDIINGLDSATWKDEMSYGNYEAKVYHTCPCNEDGLVTCVD